jgi:hypothetical protein
MSGMDKTTGSGRSRAVLQQLNAEIARHGYNKRTFAKLVDINYNQFTDYMNGKHEMPMRVLYACIDALGVPDGEFFEAARALYERTNRDD